MTFTEHEDAVVDANGNRATYARWGTREAARAALESLSGCTGCTNCVGCTDCVGCTGCVGCDRCRNCTNCVDCDDCTGCVGCDGCRNCTGCAGCARCEECVRCNECRDCLRCVGCYACSCCVGCEDCSACHDGVGIGADFLKFVSRTGPLAARPPFMFVTPPDRALVLAPGIDNRRMLLDMATALLGPLPDRAVATSLTPEFIWLKVPHRLSPTPESVRLAREGMPDWAVRPTTLAHRMATASPPPAPPAPPAPPLLSAADWLAAALPAFDVPTLRKLVAVTAHEPLVLPGFVAAGLLPGARLTCTG